MKRNRQQLIQLLREEWTCTISTLPMKDPVCTSDGHSYQKTEIQKWLRNKRTSPKTGLELSSTQVIPNIALKSVIEKFQNQIKYAFERYQMQSKALNQKIEIMESKLKERQRLIQYYKRKDQELNLLIQQINLKNKKTNVQQNLQSSLSNQKENKNDTNLIPFQSQSIRNVLPFQEYLMDVPILYDYQNNKLTHSKCKIDVSYFVMHDWSDLKILQLDSCQIDDNGFEILVNSIPFFGNLEHLSLLDNQIVNISQESLQKLKNFKVILFQVNGDYGRFLSQDSLRILKDFEKKYPQISISKQKVQQQ